MVVITFSGKAESGKDASALIFQRLMKEKGKSSLIIHYADYLKFICKQYFHWDGNKDIEGRTLLQQVGTNMIRAKNPNFWVNTVVELIKVIGDVYDYILIPDTRFPNEIGRMKTNFETISVWVHRINYENSLTEEQRNHPSETALDPFINDMDCHIYSESCLDNLEYNIKEFIESMEDM